MLSEKDHQLSVLIGFFMLIVVVIPYYFYKQLSQEERDIGGVDLKNRKLFAELVDETMLGKKVPGILA